VIPHTAADKDNGNGEVAFTTSPTTDTSLTITGAFDGGSGTARTITFTTNAAGTVYYAAAASTATGTPALSPYTALGSFAAGTYTGS
jgi:hypothetical protein